METRRKSAKVVASVLALAGLVAFSVMGYAGSLAPSAPPAPTMKTLDEVEPRIPIHAADLPLTITEPNSYYLVEDIHFTDVFNNAITLECDDVTIDLMGYTLKGPDSLYTHGIRLIDCSNVEICNGVIRDFGYDSISTSGTCSGHRVINIRAVSNPGRGIYLFCEGCLVKDCTMSGNGVGGLLVGDRGTVTGNVCNNNGSSGGIRAGSGCTVTGNTACGNGGTGITAWSGSTVTGNTTYDNATWGIFLGAYCLVDQNTAYDNGGTNIAGSIGCEYGLNIGD